MSSFRTTTWDPSLIIGQIACNQCVFYSAECLLMLTWSLVSDYRPSLDHIFTPIVSFLWKFVADFGNRLIRENTAFFLILFFETNFAKNASTDFLFDRKIGPPPSYFAVIPARFVTKIFGEISPNRRFLLTTSIFLDSSSNFHNPIDLRRRDRLRVLACNTTRQKLSGFRMYTTLLAPHSRRAL